MPNRLVQETSPYLLQHAENPVDWYAWGPEALDRARAEDKPIFLSIGYSACHWCHVMERESFEDERIARALNEHFIAIKVDREERPDLDQIYMNAVQAMTGRGGWPMSVFLTPDLKPFFGGTYWPPTPRMGMPGFDQVLSGVVEAWHQRRAAANRQADELAGWLQQLGPTAPGKGELGRELFQAAAEELLRSGDRVHGGFGDAPKFPHPMVLQLAMRIGRRRARQDLLELATLNLDKMARGGIYDHLAGGFARYSVDARWLVPHFEKMLYDNALLADAYLDGYLVTRSPEYARVVRETLDYVCRSMTDAEGGFHSTEDADSEGEEGKFYTWTAAEIDRTLDPEAAARFRYVYGVTPSGNFEGRNILHLAKTVEQFARMKGWDVRELETSLARSRAALLETRDRRVRPAKDDKVLVSWNGLMIQAMARAAAVLGSREYLAAATRAAEFLVANVRRADGRLLHAWRRGRARFDACLDDYSFLANALVTLYETCFDERWIDEAVRLADLMLAHFHDPERGGFFFTADDHERLIARNKDIYDNATPSSNAVAATVLLRLAKLRGSSRFLEAALGTLQLGADIMKRSAIAGAQLLNALDFHLGPAPEIVILGGRDETATGETLRELHSRYLPNRVIACRTTGRPHGESPHLAHLFAGKAPCGEHPTVYVCENNTCLPPVSEPAAIRQAWDRLEQHRGD
ncbi:MAG: thioredoxin domain-containing protein [Planctomycetes bacterium]|nr:thioredoxin domain-containing protein [Planctomycetota bacterium]